MLILPKGASGSTGIDGGGLEWEHLVIAPLRAPEPADRFGGYHGLVDRDNDDAQCSERSERAIGGGGGDPSHWSRW